MKNLFNLVIAAALLCGVGSCTKSDIEVAQQKVTVTFMAQLDQMNTRAVTFGKGNNVSVLYYNIYGTGSDTKLGNLSGKTARLSDGSFKFSVDMLKGMNYDIVLWAQDSTSTAYTLDGKVVTVNYRNADNSAAAPANDDTRDAFYKFIANYDPTSPTASNSFSLQRPFAQLNAAASDADIDIVTNNGMSLTSSTIKAKLYTTFNIATGDVSGLTATEVEFAATEIPSKSGEVLIAGYNYLSMNYLLVPSTGYTPDVTFTFYTENIADQTPGATFTNTLHSVPVKPNYRTNILGSLLSDTREFTVSLDSGWNSQELGPGSSL